MRSYFPSSYLYLYLSLRWNLDVLIKKKSVCPSIGAVTFSRVLLKERRAKQDGERHDKIQYYFWKERKIKWGKWAFALFILTVWWEKESKAGEEERFKETSWKWMKEKQMGPKIKSLNNREFSGFSATWNRRSRDEFPTFPVATFKRWGRWVWSFEYGLWSIGGGVGIIAGWSMLELETRQSTIFDNFRLRKDIIT